MQLHYIDFKELILELLISFQFDVDLKICITFGLKAERDKQQILRKEQTTKGTQ